MRIETDMVRIIEVDVREALDLRRAFGEFERTRLAVTFRPIGVWPRSERVQAGRKAQVGLMHEICLIIISKIGEPDHFEPAFQPGLPIPVAWPMVNAVSETPKVILKPIELYQAASGVRAHSVIDGDGRVDQHRPRG
jgi:hypothetical protein